MRLKSIFGIAAITIIGFTACSKVTELDSTTSRFRNGEWRVTDVYSTYTNRLTENLVTDSIYKTWHDCQKDNKILFLNNYKGQQLLRGSLCESSEPLEIPFEWEVVQDERKLYLHNAEYTFMYENIEANLLVAEENVIKFEFYDAERDVDADGHLDSVLITYTLGR